MKLIELLIDEEAEAYGVEAISLVEHPAIESNFIFFSRQEKEEQIMLATVDEEKQTLIGPALIPLKEIPRYDADTDETYNVYFSEDTVRRASELFLKTHKSNEHTFEHKRVINGLSVVESWIVDNPELDKSKAYGLSMPKGTWMVRVKVDNPEVWASVKSGEVKGFSIEGYFLDKIEALKAQHTPKIEVSMDIYEAFKSLFNKLKPVKLYDEAKLMTGDVMATEAEAFEEGAVVYIINPTDATQSPLSNGSYETEAGIKFEVLESTISKWDGTSPAEEEETESPIEEEVSETVMKDDYRALYEKKLAEIKASKTNLSVDRELSKQLRNLVDKVKDGELALWLNDVWEEFDDGTIDLYRLQMTLGIWLTGDEDNRDVPDYWKSDEYDVQLVDSFYSSFLEF